MNIGIIGYGVVGKAIGFSFTKIGYNVKVHDIKLDTAMEDVLETDIVYVCVPTSSLSSGACDVSIVDETVGLLNKKQYEGVIAIKSTVVPGTTDKLRHKYGLQKTCFVPEFLRERCAIADFTENVKVKMQLMVDSKEVLEIHFSPEKKGEHLFEADSIFYPKIQIEVIIEVKYGRVNLPLSSIGSGMGFQKIDDQFVPTNHLGLGLVIP